MTRGAAVAHLVRMRDMKRRRLEEWTGSDNGRHYLRKDVGAIEKILDLVERLEFQVGEARELLVEAYPDPDGFPSNEWRERVEKLGWRPVRSVHPTAEEESYDA